MSHRSRNLSRTKRPAQCSIPSFELDPSTVEATPEEVREHVRQLHADFDFWDELKSELLAEKFRNFQKHLRYYRDNIGGGINLELALLLSLLVLVAMMALTLTGSGIANQYAGAAGFLTGGESYISPDNGGATDNGDGSHTITWEGNAPPFQIIRADDPAMTDPEIVGSTPEHSYAVLPMPGDNYYQIIDGSGGQLPEPISIQRPFVLTRYEETATGIAKLGNWVPLNGGNYSGAALLRSTITGEAMTLTFVGNRCDLVAMRSSGAGMLRVILDGQPQPLVDLYNPSFVFRSRVWSSGEIAAGTHTLRVENTGSKNPLSMSSAVNVDAFDIWGALR